MGSREGESEEGPTADRALGSSGRGRGVFPFRLHLCPFRGLGVPQAQRAGWGGVRQSHFLAELKPLLTGAPLGTEGASQDACCSQRRSFGWDQPPSPDGPLGRRLSDGPPQANEDTSPSCALPNGEAAAARTASCRDSAGGRAARLRAGLPLRRTRAELHWVCLAEALPALSWRSECGDPGPLASENASLGPYCDSALRWARSWEGPELGLMSLGVTHSVHGPAPQFKHGDLITAVLVFGLTH